MTGKKDKERIMLFTIGHSTHPIEDFINLLKANQIEIVVDVRTIPKSRHNPQFNTNELAASLKKSRVDYLHMRGLGGLRHAVKDSVNVGWRAASFRGFADYMQTGGFDDNIGQLIKLSEKHRIAIMCAEAVPWRCHRSLIADALLIRGIKPVHIISKSSLRIHELTPFAKVNGVQITYPKA